jgi:hypothetical protein
MQAKKRTKRDILFEANRRLQETTQQLFMAKQELEKRNKELEEARERERLQKEKLEQFEQITMKHLAGRGVKKKPFQRDKAIQSYREAIREYMTQSNAEPAETAEKTAEDFFKKGVSGKDVIDIHLAAIDTLTKELRQDMAGRIVDQARFLLLGILANLTDLYSGK